MDNYDDYEEYEEYPEYDDEDIEENYEDVGDADTVVVSTLAVISKWFIYIGVAIAAILLLYFVFTLKFFNVFLFILGLVIAYFFGYFFMFCLDTFISNNDRILYLSGEGSPLPKATHESPLFPNPCIVYLSLFKSGILYILSLYFLYDLSFILGSLPNDQQYELFCRAFEEKNSLTPGYLTLLILRSNT